MTSNGIGDRIREAREQAGLKRVQLAVAADVAPNTIRNYEEGFTDPSLTNLRRIAEATRVDLMWLIGVREEVA